MTAMIAGKEITQRDAIETLKAIDGLGRDFAVLSAKNKEKIGSMKEGGSMLNRGVEEALSREITIAFSHNERFRPPPRAIVLLYNGNELVGEMTDTGPKYYDGACSFNKCILPPVPFPELDREFAEVCSASPGHDADNFIREIIRVEPNDATLLVGFNIK